MFLTKRVAWAIELLSLAEYPLGNQEVPLKMIDCKAKVRAKTTECNTTIIQYELSAFLLTICALKENKPHSKCYYSTLKQFMTRMNDRLKFWYVTLKMRSIDWGNTATIQEIYKM